MISFSSGDLSDLGGGEEEGLPEGLWEEERFLHRHHEEEESGEEKGERAVRRAFQALGALEGSGILGRVAD